MFDLDDLFGPPCEEGIQQDKERAKKAGVPYLSQQDLDELLGNMFKSDKKETNMDKLTSTAVIKGDYSSSKLDATDFARKAVEEKLNELKSLKNKYKIEISETQYDFGLLQKKVDKKIEALEKQIVGLDKVITQLVELDNELFVKSEIATKAAVLDKKIEAQKATAPKKLVAKKKVKVPVNPIEDELDKMLHALLLAKD